MNLRKQLESSTMSKKQEGVTGGGILQILRWVITWLNRGVAAKEQRADMEQNPNCDSKISPSS